MSNSRSSGGYGENLRHMLRALRGRNYALFFFGQGMSLVGTWMQTVAQGTLVWKLTHDMKKLAWVAFAAQIFGFLLAPLAGVLSDRWNRHRTILVTQSLAMVQATTLAALTLTGVVEYWHVLVLAGMMGLINSFDVPTRQSFVVKMVEHREDLPNAIALNSFIFNGARLVGPFLAGVLIPLFSSGGTAVSPNLAGPATAAAAQVSFHGEGVCFLLNAASYIAILWALAAMRLPPWQAPQRVEHMLHSLAEGARYSFGFAPIRSILLMLGWTSLVSMPYAVLLPAFTSEVLHHGQAQIPLLHWGKDFLLLRYESTYGLLVSSAGMGAILGAIYLASRKSVLGLGRWIIVASSLLGVGLILFSLSRVVLLSMGLLMAVGFGLMVQMASSNTILQTIVDEDKRGRVMSFYAVSFLGTAPFGAWAAGALGPWLGSPATLAISGLACLAGSAAFAVSLPKWRRLTRPIYVRIGILSEDAAIPKDAAEQDIQTEGDRSGLSD